MLATNKRDDENVKEFKEQFICEPRGVAGFNFVQTPLGLHPNEFVKAHFGDNAAGKHLQFAKGTTTLSFIYEPATSNDKGGVVVAVDSRASSGEYVASATVSKILDINDTMVATMAGGAADCQFWIRMVAKYCNLFELRERTNITVAATSKYFANVLYSWRNYGLSVGSMVAGYDKRGPSLFYVDNDGRRLPMRVCSVGSGCLNAYAILDTHYKPKMTDDEAIKLARRAIMHATYRDAGSGGQCTVCHITADGKTKYPRKDVSDLYYEFANEIGRDDPGLFGGTQSDTERRTQARTGAIGAGPSGGAVRRRGGGGSALQLFTEVGGKCAAIARSASGSAALREHGATLVALCERRRDADAAGAEIRWATYLPVGPGDLE